MVSQLAGRSVYQSVDTWDGPTAAHSVDCSVADSDYCSGDGLDDHLVGRSDGQTADDSVGHWAVSWAYCLDARSDNHSVVLWAG